MSKFTEMWRVTHDEPLTYNERIINSACDIIERQDKRTERLQKDIDCINSLCDNFDEFGEPFKESEWPFLSERVFGIVTELLTKIKELESEDAEPIPEKPDSKPQDSL